MLLVRRETELVHAIRMDFRTIFLCAFVLLSVDASRGTHFTNYYSNYASSGSQAGGSSYQSPHTSQSPYPSSTSSHLPSESPIPSSTASPSTLKSTNTFSPSYQYSSSSSTSPIPTEYRYSRKPTHFLLATNENFQKKLGCTMRMLQHQLLEVS